MNSKENGTGKNNLLSNEQLMQMNGGDNVASIEAYAELLSMAYEAISQGTDLEIRLTSIMHFARQYYESGALDRSELYALKYCISEELDCNGYGNLKQYVFYPINDLA